MSIILASQSPRRKELMAKITDQFSVQPSAVDEKKIFADDPVTLCRRLAEAKCLDVASRFPQDAVIGSDTIVDCDGTVMGKPANYFDAEEMLHSLSGREHFVHTAVCIAYRGKKDVFCQTSRVEFFDIGDEEIHQYVLSGEPMDKAGAYAIQGGASLFVKEIQGDFYGIMGLPVGLVRMHLKKMGILQ